MVLLALMPPLVLAVSPLSGAWLFLLAALAFIYYWLWYNSLAQLRQSTLLTLTDDGQLHWFGHYRHSGQLTGGGLVAQYVIRLRWRDSTGKCGQCWVFADQCNEAQYRALARVVNQSNWSPKGPDKPYSDNT